MWQRGRGRNSILKRLRYLVVKNSAFFRIFLQTSAKIFTKDMKLIKGYFLVWGSRWIVLFTFTYFKSLFSAIYVNPKNDLNIWLYECNSSSFQVFLFIQAEFSAIQKRLKVFYSSVGLSICWIFLKVYLLYKFLSNLLKINIFLQCHSYNIYKIRFFKFIFLYLKKNVNYIW